MCENMPTIDLSMNDYENLLKLIGRKIDIEDLEEIIFLLKGEMEVYEENGEKKISIEIPPDRIDMLSIGGLARSIKGYLNIETGKPKYSTIYGDIEVKVNQNIIPIRPYIAVTILHNVKLDEDLLKHIMTFQEKLHGTWCRNRRKASIGIYDFNKVKPPLYYEGVEPNKIRFIPLDTSIEMNGYEILSKTPRGKEYGHLLRDKNLYPILRDSERKVLSMPPIINSEDTRVTVDTRDIVIDVTGLDKYIVNSILNVLAYNFAEHGWIIERTKIVTPNGVEYTPQKRGGKLSLDKDYVNRITGLNLSENKIAHLLRKMRYEVKINGDKIDVEIPPYRLDILHPVDLIEDVAIAYGFNKIVPELPNISTIGHELDIYKVVRKIRDIMVGLGFQEVLNYIMSNKDLLFIKMNKNIEEIVEVMNPKSTQYTVLRNSIIPGLLNFLSKNKHVEYPQKIFEIGEIVYVDSRTETKTVNHISLGFAITNFSLSLEDGLAVVYALFKNLGIEKFKLISLKDDPSFIKGRVGKIIVNEREAGIIGEVNPIVLENFELENPTIACEIDIEKIGKLFRSFYL